MQPVGTSSAKYKGLVHQLFTELRICESEKPSIHTPVVISKEGLKDCHIQATGLVQQKELGWVKNNPKTPALLFYLNLYRNALPS